MRTYNMVSVVNEPHQVFLVQDVKTGRFYVKKLLNVYNPAVYEKLYQEQIAGIPQIVEYEESHGKCTVIEEYISGETLQDLIAEEILTPCKVIDYIVKLCDILARLHTMTPPIIHRDLKPSNVMITSYDMPFLLDFNAAKEFHAEAESDTRLLGTPGYAAPEQFGFGVSSPQTDIYALGILMKEMMDSCKEKEHRLDEMIHRCTQMDPAKRYQNVAELRAALCGLNEQNVLQEKAREMEQEKPSNRRFFPPGFRSGTLWKMIVGVIGYVCIFDLSLTVEFQNVTAAGQWLERGMLLLILLSFVCIGSNYLDVQQAFPLCRSKNQLLHLIGVILFDAAVAVVILTVALFAESIFL